MIIPNPICEKNRHMCNECREPSCKNSYVRIHHAVFVEDYTCDRLFHPEWDQRPVRFWSTGAINTGIYRYYAGPIRGDDHKSYCIADVEIWEVVLNPEDRRRLGWWRKEEGGRYIEVERHGLIGHVEPYTDEDIAEAILFGDKVAASLEMYKAIWSK